MRRDSHGRCDRICQLRRLPLRFSVRSAGLCESSSALRWRLANAGKKAQCHCVLPDIEPGRARCPRSPGQRRRRFGVASCFARGSMSSCTAFPAPIARRLNPESKCRRPMPRHGDSHEHDLDDQPQPSRLEQQLQADDGILPARGRRALRAYSSPNAGSVDRTMRAVSLSGGSAFGAIGSSESPDRIYGRSRSRTSSITAFQSLASSVLGASGCVSALDAQVR